MWRNYLECGESFQQIERHFLNILVRLYFTLREQQLLHCLRRTENEKRKTPRVEDVMYAHHFM